MDEETFRKMMTLGNRVGPDYNNVAGLMEAMRGRQLNLGPRESTNIRDERNFANEHPLIRANAEAASKACADICGPTLLRQDARA